MLGEGSFGENGMSKLSISDPFLEVGVGRNFQGTRPSIVRCLAIMSVSIRKLEIMG